MIPPDLIVLLILLAGIIFSIGRKKLTLPAALTGAILGWLVYKGGGYTGLAMLTSFFILGTAATSWKKKEKMLIKGHAAHQQTRTAGQVIANGGIGRYRRRLCPGTWLEHPDIPRSHRVRNAGKSHRFPAGRRLGT
jgi:uncharacterized membrane protein